MTGPHLFGRRIVLRPLALRDHAGWREVRERSRDWLTVWEPSMPVGVPDPVSDRTAFAMRCAAKERERTAGTGCGFGIFVDGLVAGEININSIQRGPFQNATVGYWIDQTRAGHGYMPEALVVVLRHAFDDLSLHRIQIAIIPRNSRSRRVVEKVGVRSEGIARRYLEINGVWEDHIIYAMTAEEWDERRDALGSAFA